MTVYYTCLLDSGLYVMIEICRISMPRDATQLRLFVAVCEGLSPVQYLYKKHCRLSNDLDNLKSKMRVGVSDKIFSEIVGGMKNRKRPCPVLVNQ